MELLLVSGLVGGLMNVRNKNYYKARKYFNLKWGSGLVMHHKDVNMKHENPERYLQWNPEDLEIMTNEDHRKLHAELEGFGKGPKSEETRNKISSTRKKMFQSGELNMNGENNSNYGNRWKRTPEMKYHKTKGSSKRVRCVETGIIYPTRKAAMEATGASKKITSACNDGTISGGYHWEWVD